MNMRRGNPVLRDLAGLVGFLAVSLAVSGLGGAVTATSVDGWYRTLEKPPFNPPDWLFAPVWITLFVIMAVAGWRCWRRTGLGSRAMAAFAIQLCLNLLWSVLFFGLRSPGLALVEVVVLWIAIGYTTLLFFRLDRLAGVLFIPYFCWVAFAILLNAAIVYLN